MANNFIGRLFCISESGGPGRVADYIASSATTLAGSPPEGYPYLVSAPTIVLNQNIMQFVILSQTNVNPADHSITSSASEVSREILADNGVQLLADMNANFVAASNGTVTAVTAQLGAAAHYAILAAAGITNTGSTVVSGGVIGTFPTTTITFDGGTATVDNGNANAAQIAALAAYNFYAGLTFTSLGGGIDLSTANGSGGNTYTPGNYSFGAATCSGGVVLNGAGLYVFKGSSTINLANGQSVTLTNGAQAANVIWLVGTSFTSVAVSNMVGTILADTSITLGGGTLTGRAIAGIIHTTGAVTISAQNNITTSAGTGRSGPALTYVQSVNADQKFENVSMITVIQSD